MSNEVQGSFNRHSIAQGKSTVLFIYATKEKQFHVGVSEE